MGRRGRKRRSIGRADRSATRATDRPSIARDGDDGAATRRIAGSARARVARMGGEGDPASRARRGGLASRGRRGLDRAHLSGDVYHARVRHRDRPSRVERIPSRALARGRSFPIKSATMTPGRSLARTRARSPRATSLRRTKRARSLRARDGRAIERSVRIHRTASTRSALARAPSTLSVSSRYGLGEGRRLHGTRGCQKALVRLGYGLVRT